MQKVRNPKVSVIVPVYGVEKYIERCVRSLMEQTLDCIEFIFVDDCSPDGSVNIIEQVVHEYKTHLLREHKIVRIERMDVNQGQAAVRKYGMLLATGDYVIHCDSDDWVDKDMYRILYEQAIKHDYDMVWCDYYRSDGNHHKVISQYCDSNKIQLLQSFLDSTLIGSVWNRLYKRRFHMSPNFIFPKDNMTEDLAIVIQVVLQCKTFCYVPNPLYYYYYNTDSICMSSNKDLILKNLQGVINNTSIILNTINRFGLSEKMESYIICKKCRNRDVLIPLLNQRKYRKLWFATYPEVNKYLFTNQHLSMQFKIRAICLLTGTYFIYNLIKACHKA